MLFDSMEKEHQNSPGLNKYIYIVVVSKSHIICRSICLLFSDIRSMSSATLFANHDMAALTFIWQHSSDKETAERRILASFTWNKCFVLAEPLWGRRAEKTWFIFLKRSSMLSDTMSFSNLNTLKLLPKHYWAISVRHNLNNPSTNLVNLPIISLDFDQ